MADYKRPVSQGPNRTPLTREDNLPTYEMQNWMNVVAGNSVKLQLFEETLDPDPVSANSTDEQEFTVSGIETTDVIVSINKPSLTNDLSIGGWRAGDGSVFITFVNGSGGSVNPASEEYLILVLKR